MGQAGVRGAVRGLFLASVAGTAAICAAFLAAGSGATVATETLAYVSDRGGIHLVNGAGGPTRRLPGAGNAIDFAWSPDGTHLAFTAITIEGGNPYSDIWEVRADGRGLRRLTHNRLSSSPFWSPDGKFIYYGGGGSTWQMRPDGSDKHPLGKHHAPVGGWSPDARLEAWAGEDRIGRFQLFVSNADGSNPKQVTHNRYTFLGDDVSFSQPAWSPDGKRLAFVETRGDHSDLALVGTDGRGRHSIAASDPGVPNDGPDWSATADVIAFEGAGGNIYLVKPDGSKLTRLTHSAVNVWSPRWRPHGS